MIKYEKVHDLIKREKLDALLVMSPYNRRYLSQFTGSSGAVIITENEKYLISDFRYNTQAREEAEDLYLVLQQNCKIDININYIKQNYLITVGFGSSHVKLYTRRAIADYFELVTMRNEVEKIKIIKRADELELIKKSFEIAQE